MEKQPEPELTYTWKVTIKASGNSNRSIAAKIPYDPTAVGRIVSGQTQSRKSAEKVLDAIIDRNTGRLFFCPSFKVLKDNYCKTEKERKSWEEKYEHHFTDKLFESTLISCPKLIDQISNKMQEMKNDIKDMSEQKRGKEMEYCEFYFNIFLGIVEQAALDSFKETQDGEAEK